MRGVVLTKHSFCGLMVLLVIVGVFSCNSLNQEQKPAPTALFHSALFEGMDANTTFRMKHYLLQGYLLYKQHCANCHGKQGQGLNELYPPLAGTRLSATRMACLIRYGSSPSNVPNATDTAIFTPTMPDHLPLRPIQVAEIITFVQNAWGNYQHYPERITSVKAIQVSLDSCQLPL